MKRLSKRTNVLRFRPILPSTPAVDIAAQRYSLTTAEKNVLSAVMDSGGVRAVASALKISEATVKTHLQNIFGKTGARRQIDLVKLVIAVSASERTGPLAHDQLFASSS
jgi:DNA-binding NarL/FixJ family response regulator